MADKALQWQGAKGKLKAPAHFQKSLSGLVFAQSKHRDPHIKKGLRNIIVRSACEFYDFCSCSVTEGDSREFQQVSRGMDAGEAYQGTSPAIICT